MKIAIAAIGGAIAGACAVCFMHYVRNAEEPTIAGFLKAAKEHCVK